MTDVSVTIAPAQPAPVVTILPAGADPGDPDVTTLPVPQGTQVVTVMPLPWTTATPPVTQSTRPSSGTCPKARTRS